jgi:hypothetical protein
MSDRFKVDSFMLPGYDTPDAHPASLAAENTAQTSEVGGFSIPPVFWMIVFLLVGYFGLRMILEEA